MLVCSFDVIGWLWIQVQRLKSPRFARIVEAAIKEPLPVPFAHSCFQGACKQGTRIGTNLITGVLTMYFFPNTKQPYPKLWSDPGHMPTWSLGSAYSSRALQESVSHSCDRAF